MSTPNASQAESLKIRHEQVYLLYKPSFNAAIATMFAACFLVYIQWNSIPHHTLILWLSVMTFIITARIFYYLTFQKKRPCTKQIPFWGKSYTLLTMGAGATWGSAGIFLFPQGNFEQQAATIVILAGMAAGSVTTLSALRAPVFIFLFFTMTPLTTHLFLEFTTLGISFSLMCSVYIIFLANTANDMYKTHLQNITLRIQSAAKEKTIRESEQTIRKTSEILKMIAKGTSTSPIYDAIALFYESQHPGLRCSLLELKGNKLLHGGAPSLPKVYCEAVNGLENGPNIGSCGTSTFTGKRVLVEDISTDPKWDKLKEVALPHGLRSCWSEPIKDNTGKVLGAFGMYYNHRCLPNAEQLADLQAGARLAGIVMEREQHENLLKRFHSAFEYAHDAIMISDLDARLEYVNTAFEKMTGYSSQEAVGQFIKILRSDEHSSQFYDDLLKQDSSGKPWKGNITIKRKDGTLCEVERSVSPVFDEHDNISFLVAIQRDLTEHKILEAQFQQAQKMEAIGTLVGGIAHDFNNILAGMTGNLYLAKKATETQGDVQQKLNNVEALSFRAADLIQQLLTFARKSIVHLKHMPLTPFFQDLRQFTCTIIPENIHVNYAVTSQDLFIRGDTTLLHQVLVNLITNARDAVQGMDTPTISIKLDAFYANASFIQQHTYFKLGTYAHISVKDNGTGIPQDDIEHIFEPFFTTKEQGKGTGLGLSMAFGAIKTHQGFIEVKSNEGQGSTFHVYIPLQDEQPITAQPTPQNKTTQGQGEWILLVDDQPEVLETGTEVLEVLGYQVLQASDGLEAVEVFKVHQEEIALVLIDVVMPKLGGVDAVKHIRTIKPNVAIIFATGYDKETTFPELASSSEFVILNKPYNIDELSHTISQKLSTLKSEQTSSYTP